MKRKWAVFLGMGILIYVSACGMKKEADVLKESEVSVEETITVEDVNDSIENVIEEKTNFEIMVETTGSQTEIIKRIIEDNLYKNNYNKSENEDWIIYECEPREDGYYDEKFTMQIKKNFMDKIYTQSQAKDFFDEYLGDYHYLEHYIYMESRYGLTGAYLAIKNENDITKRYYYIYGEDENTSDIIPYFVCLSGRTDVFNDLLGSYRTTETLEEYKNYNIILDNGDEWNRVINADYEDYENGFVRYEFYLNGNEEPENILELLVEDGNYTMSVFVNEKVVQCIEWEVLGAISDNSPSFFDANYDGYLDVMVVTAQDTSKGLSDIHLWDNVNKQYIKVDGLFGEVSARDGQLWNWLDHYTEKGRNGFILQKFKWEGNNLILLSEEVVEPED